MKLKKVFLGAIGLTFILSLAFLFIGINATKAQIINSQGQMSISGFTLVNADTNQDIGPLVNGQTVDLDMYPSITVRANTNPSVVGSVKFGLNNNQNYKTENLAPYYLCEDRQNGNDPLPCQIQPGEVRISATPYSLSRARGVAGQSSMISFNAVRSGGQNNTNNNNSPIAVTSFTLVNADTNQPIGQINNGSTINISNTPNISIIANTQGNVGSVRFFVNGQVVRTENVAPYSIAADSGNPPNYLPWDYPTGQINLTALPSTLSRFRGETGTPFSVIFSFVLDEEYQEIEEEYFSDENMQNRSSSGNLIAPNSVQLVSPTNPPLTSVSVGQTIPMTCSADVAAGSTLNTMVLSWFKTGSGVYGEFHSVNNIGMIGPNSGSWTQNVTIPSQVAPGDQITLKCNGYYNPAINPSPFGQQTFNVVAPGISTTTAINISSPAQNFNALRGQPFNVTISALPTNGQVSNIELFYNDNFNQNIPLGSDNTSPYVIPVTLNDRGYLCPSIRAKATLIGGGVLWSDPLMLVITDAPATQPIVTCADSFNFPGGVKLSPPSPTNFTYETGTPFQVSAATVQGGSTVDYVKLIHMGGNVAQNIANGLPAYTITQIGSNMPSAPYNQNYTINTSGNIGNPVFTDVIAAYAYFSNGAVKMATQGIKVNQVVNSSSIQSFELVGPNGQVIQTLTNGQTINIGTQGGGVGQNISIRATTNPSTVGSVQFNLTGGLTHSQADNTSPYTLFGDSGPNSINVWPNIIPGGYTLSATPYAGTGGQNGGSLAGTSSNITFNIVNNDDTTPPNNPTNVAITYRSANQIKLSWANSNSSDIHSYKVYRNNNSIGIVNHPTNIYIDNQNLNSTGSYSYKVTAIDNAGNEATLPQNGVQSPVLSTLFSINERVVSSDANTEVRSSPESTQSTVVGVGNFGTVQNGPVWVNGTQYWYVDFDSAIDGWVREADILPLPLPPSNFVGSSPSATSIQLNWIDNSNNETGFEIQRSTSQNFSNPVTINKSANSTSELVTGLSANTDYYFRIRSVIGGLGHSAWVQSNPLPITTGSSQGGAQVNTTCPNSLNVINQTNGNKDAVILCSAVNESTPSITIHWSPISGRTVNSISVFRKTESASSWTQIATPSASSASWTDLNVTIGEYYEYRVVMNTSLGSASGYISSGIKVAQDVYRGKIVLVVDNSFANGVNGSNPSSGSLSTQVNQLIEDLNADKWVVHPVYVSRTELPANVRSLIQSVYNADPSNTKAVYLLGHIPVASIGNVDPDGHGSRGISSDSYYGEMNSTWNNVAGGCSGYTQNPLMVSSGYDIPSNNARFCHSSPPSSLELEVGRVDFYKVTAFSGQNESSLLSNYLTKARNFKRRQFVPQDRIYIKDRLAIATDSTFVAGRSPLSTISSIVGLNNLTYSTSTTPTMPTVLNNQSYLFAYGNVWGIDTSSTWENVAGSTSAAASTPWGSVFNILLASYLSEWNDQNAYLKSLLGSGNALTTMYGGTNYFFLHPMIMGKNIGYTYKLSINNTSLYTPAGGIWNNSTTGRSYMTLLGDPTLRSHYVAMPSNLTFSNVNNNINFSWNASSDTSVIGYNIYEIQQNLIRKVNQSIINSTSFASNESYSVNKRYMVTAVKIHSLGGGTYYNESLGSIAIVGSTGGGPLNDTTPPVATITAPTSGQVLSAGTTSTPLTVTTDENATCKWHTSDVTYANMPNTMSGSGTMSHTANITGLANGNNYTRFVRCQDTSSNANTMTTSVSVSFSVATPGTGGGAPIVYTPQRSFTPNQVAVVCNSQYSQSCQLADYYIQQRGIPPQNKVTLNFSAPMTTTGAVMSRSTFETGFGGTNMRAHVLNQISSAYSSAGLGTPDIQSALLMWRYPFIVADGITSASNCFATSAACISLVTAFSKGQYNPADANNSTGSMPTNPYFETTTGFLTPRTTHNIVPAFLLPFESGNYNQGKQFIDQGKASDNTYPTGKVYSVTTYDQNRGGPRHSDYQAVAGLFNQNNLSTEHKISPLYPNSTGGHGTCSQVTNGMTGWPGPSENGISYLNGNQDVLGYQTGLSCIPLLSTLTFRPGALADHFTSNGGMLTQSGTSGGTEGAQMPITEWLKFGVVASAGTMKEPWDGYSTTPLKFPKTTQLWKEYYTGASAIQAYWSSVQKNGNTNFVGEPLANPWKDPQITFANNTLSINITHIKPGETWKLQSSSNGSSWTDVSGQTNITAPNNKFGLRTITLSNATAPYYRLVNNANSSLPQIQRPVNGSTGGGPLNDTTPPVATITAPTSGQVLSAGTTSTPLTVTTDENATCKWHTSDVTYANMPNTMSGSGTMSHTANITGLANGNNYTRFVRCQDTSSNANTMTTSVSVSFSVATPGTGGGSPGQVLGISGYAGPSTTENETPGTNPYNGRNFYVSCTGNDSNNGTSSNTPWATIEKVNSLSKIPGDRIMFKRGCTYRGQLNVNQSGNSSQPIEFSAYGTGTPPVISGTSLVTGWTVHDGNIYKANVGTGLNIKYLFASNQYQTLAKQPNTGFYFTNGKTSTSISDTDNPWLTSQSTNSLSGAQIVMRAHIWSYVRRNITGNSGSTINFASMPYGQNYPNAKWGYILQNKFSFLDQPGEWFYDSATGVIYFQASGNQNPNNLVVEIVTNDYGFLLGSNITDIVIRNLNIEKQNVHSVRIQSNRRVLVENNKIGRSIVGIRQYLSSGGPESDRNIFRNNHIYETNEYGIYLISDGTISGSGHIVEGNVIENISLAVERMTESQWAHFGVATGGVNGRHTIRRNIVRDIGYIGMNINGSGIITENLVERPMRALTDGGAIAFDYTDGGMIISKNIVKDVYSNDDSIAEPVHAGWEKLSKGYYFGDQSIKNVTLENNIAVNVETSGIWIDHNLPYENNKVQNNIVYNAGKYGIGLSDYSNYRSIGDGSGIGVCGALNNSVCFKSSYNDTVSGNKVYSINSSQVPLHLLQVYSNGQGAIADFGTFTNNYYYNPFRSTKVNMYRMFTSQNTDLSLSAWQSSPYNEDLNSTQSTYTLSNPNQAAQIFYNPTLSPITQSVNGCNANGTPLTGTQTIQPFSALVVEYGNC